MGALNWPTKSPAEVLDYTINWGQALANDTILTSDWAISDASLVETNATNTGTSATIWLSQGTNNVQYVVTNTIVTAGGRTFDQDVNIRVGSN